jgi:hypothetical protein
LPTKNNIESSRGHTCVLIKIISGNEIKYFPLFDMAGTENVISMNEFFTSNRNITKMNKLIGIISDLSKNNGIRDNKLKENKFFASLNDVLKNDKIEGYVKTQQGGKGDYNIDDANNDINKIESNYSNITGTNLIQKILGEGYYINHTIGMLIYIAKCVGCSINSPMIDGNDQFDSIGAVVVDQMNNYIMYYNKGNEQGTGKTRVLLDSIDFNSILQKSSIWVQILFSFLYWNEENTKTFDKIIEECSESKPDNNNDNDNNDNKQLCVYLGEQLDSKNINPSAPGNSENYNMDGVKLFSYNKFFNNFYSIQELKKNPIKTIEEINIKDKIKELSNLYNDVSQKPETVEYTLKIKDEENKLVFTNETIEAYKTYIYNDNLYSEENFYKVLQGFIDANKDTALEDYKYKMGYSNEVKKNKQLIELCKTTMKNTETGFSCHFNLNEMTTLYGFSSVKQNIIFHIIRLQTQIIRKYLSLELNENINNIVTKYNKNNLDIQKIKIEIETLPKSPNEITLKKLFPYNTQNQQIFENYMKAQLKNINTKLAEEYKKDKKFTELIEYENPTLYQLAKNFNGSNKTLNIANDNYIRSMISLNKLKLEITSLNSTMIMHYQQMISDSKYLKKLEMIKPEFLNSLTMSNAKLTNVENLIVAHIVQSDDKDQMMQLIKDIRNTTFYSTNDLSKQFLNHYEKYKKLIKSDSSQYSTDKLNLDQLLGKYNDLNKYNKELYEEYKRINIIVQKLQESMNLSRREVRLFKNLIQSISNILTRKSCVNFSASPENVTYIGSKNTQCATELLKSHIDNNLIR